MPRTPRNQPPTDTSARGVYRHPNSPIRIAEGAPLRVGLYARVSTPDQATSLIDQLAQLRAYAALRGWIIALELSDVAGGGNRRPNRAALIEAAHRREIDVIAVCKLDRWGRGLADLVTGLDDLAHLGVAFVALGDAIDLTTASGRAMVGMLAVFASFERDRIRERVREGLAAAKVRGKRLGRKPKHEEHVAKVRELANAGMSKRAIAAELGMSRDTVRRYLAFNDGEKHLD